MRTLATAAVATLLTSISFAGVARAADPEPDGAVALMTGAATILGGFVVGGALVATGGENPGTSEAGWLVMESSFALAPLTSHAAVGEWWRGAAFASVPAATTLGSVPIFLKSENAVNHSVLFQQEALWWCFGGGLASAVVGVIDATFAPGRAVRVAPALGPREAGLTLSGVL